MKIINPGVEYIPQTDNTLNGIYKQIEKAGRTCYKSEDKITEDSAEAFVHRMIESNHTAMLEHGTIYMKMTIDNYNRSEILRYPWYHKNEPTKLQEVFGYVQSLFMFNPYSVVNLHHDRDTDTTVMCITTNYRVIIENGWSDMMNEIICEPTEYHTPRITLKFTTNIGVTREGNRMRANSIAEESTRYCNYSNDKFGNEITFTAPSWLSKEQITSHDSVKIAKQAREVLESGNYTKEEMAELVYLRSCAESELNYLFLIELGWKPQQAREVLPLATKSDVVYTAFPHQWRHFFDLRLFGKTGVPHPNMQYIASLARDILCENDLWYLIYKPDEPEFSAHQLEGDNARKQD